MADSIDAVWALLQQHQQEAFHTAKGLPFTYTIRGGELFVDRRQKSITVSTVANALEKIAALEEAGIEISGPKKLGCYGASYLYPVLLTLGGHSGTRTRRSRAAAFRRDRIYHVVNCEHSMKTIQNTGRA